MSTLRNTTPRSTARVFTIATLAAALPLAACSDSATAPLGGAARTPSFAATTTVGDTTVTTFRVDPTDTRMIVIVGTHKLDIPPGSICDLATSGYGRDLWDAPCTPSATSVTFTAKTWNDASGNPQITFSPDVRFVPGKVVTLSIKAQKASQDSSGRVVWCPSDGSACVDEALADPTLATVRDPQNGSLTRRVKHFSGYNVILGFGGDGESQEMARVRVPNVVGASGYITTTGLIGTDLDVTGSDQ
jgi:hypothetical protein